MLIVGGGDTADVGAPRLVSPPTYAILKCDRKLVNAFIVICKVIRQLSIMKILIIEDEKALQNLF